MKLVFTALFSLLAILAAPSAETSSVSMGGLAPHFYIEAEDRAALSYNRASTPFCFGLYIGSTNQPPSEFELVCLFTNAAMGPDLPQGFTLGKPIAMGRKDKGGPILNPQHKLLSGHDGKLSSSRVVPGHRGELRRGLG